MDTNGYKTKFKTLFDKLLHNKFELSAYHSEKLLQYLDGNRDKCIAKMIETPFFADLLINAMKNDGLASTSVKIFITELVSIVLQNEVHFNRFLQMQGFELIILRARANPPDGQSPVPLQLAMARQVAALSAHYSGVKYLIETKLYTKVLTSHTHREHPSVAAVIYEFMTNLIWKLSEYEEEPALLEVLRYVVNPLVTSPLAALDAENQTVVSEQLLSFLQTLVHILGEVEQLETDNNVVTILTQTFSIESTLSNALQTTRDTALARLLAEVSLRFYYAVSRQSALHDAASKPLVNLPASFYKITCTLIQKRSYTTVLEFFCNCHIFWQKVNRVVPSMMFEKYGRKFEMQIQFVIMLLLPVFLKQTVKRLVNDPALKDANEIFHGGLIKIVPYDNVSSAYALKAVIVETEDSNLASACAKSVQLLLRLRGLLSRQLAGVAFQSMFYTLSEYVLSDGAGGLVLLNPLRTPEDERLLSLVLEAITMLLDEHDINWYESLEIVELQAALTNLIKQNILPVKLLVQAVDLITLSVRKLLFPELSLLMQSRRGGSLREAAGAARALLARSESDARAAALRLQLSFTDVAYVKFIPLRAVISQHGLVVTAARVALTDTSSHAQASALRCLAAAAKCEDLWAELLTHQRNLYDLLVGILCHNPEGEVRKEAANVLSHVYINHKVSENFTVCVSQAMARAALTDSHWPVQIAALNYWKQFMLNQFTNRGMIDGRFPSVTFCKEKRKIISLNEKEIHKQLHSILQQLSATGCLAVLLKCLDSCNNSEVIEISFHLSGKLVHVLDFYNYNTLSGVNLSPQVGDNTDVDTAASSRDPRKLDQSDLISEIFDCSSTESSRIDCSSPVEVVSPQTFVETFKAVERRWNSQKADLGALIDELVST